MAGNRKAAQEFILKYVDKIAPGGHNRSLYESIFSKMSDKAFDEFMKDLKSGAKFLVVIDPNLKGSKITTENNLKIASELGHEFFTALQIEGKEDTPTYMTPIKYLVVDLPVRRASQSLTKKISVPDNMKVIDSLTGQPTGGSKGAKISYPELQLCVAMGLEKSMLELVKYRGGDQGGYSALKKSLSGMGQARLAVLAQFASGVQSTKLLKSFLTSAMLKSSLT